MPAARSPEELHRAMLAFRDAGQMDKAKEVARYLKSLEQEPEAAPVPIGMTPTAPMPAGDTSPMQLPPDMIDTQRLISLADSPQRGLIGMPGGFGLMAAPGLQAAGLNIPTAQREMAQQGVDVGRGLPEARARMNLAPNQEFAYNALDGILTQKFGAKVPVKYDEKAKDFMFLAPDTNRWTTVNEYGFSRGDLKDMLLSSATPAAAVAGGLLGMPGGPVGVAAGAGGGVLAAELGKLHLGKHLGVHDLSNQEILMRAGKAAGLEAAFSLAGEKAFQLAQLSKRLFSPQPLAREDASALMRQWDDMVAEVQELRKTLGPEFDPIPPQVAGDAASLLMVDAASDLSPAVREAYNARMAATAGAVQGYGDQLMPAQGADVAQVGQAMQLRANMEREARVAARIQAGDVLARQVAEDMDQLIPSISSPEAGRAIRQQVQQEADVAKGVRQKLWNDVDEYLGIGEFSSASKYPKVPLSRDAVRIFARMNEQARRAMLSAERSSVSRAIPDPAVVRDGAKQAGGPVSGDIMRSADMGVLDALESAIRQGDLERSTMDLAQIDRSIKFLRGELRDRTSDISTRDMEQSLAALVSTRNDFLRKVDPDGLAMLEAAEAATRVEADLFQDSIVGKMLAKDGRTYKMTDAQLFASIFDANDPEAALAVARSVRGNPAAAKVFKDATYALYRREVAPEGIPNIIRHREFMLKYGDVLDQFFPDSTDRAMFRTLGGFADVIERESKQVAAYTKALDKAFTGKLTGYQPSEIMELALKPGTSVEEVRAMSRIIDDAGMPAGALRADFNAAFGNQLRAQFTSRDSVFDANKMYDFLFGKNGRKNKEKLAALMGPEYVRDLAKLQRSALISQRRGSGRTPDYDGSAMALVNGWSRVIARPLSRLGLFRTAAMKNRAVIASKFTYDLLTDPEKLRIYVNMMDQQVTNREIVQFFTNMGAASLLDDPPPFIDENYPVMQ